MKQDSKDIVITGASGRLGTSLVAAALTRGHRVIATSRRQAMLPASTEPNQLIQLSGLDLTDSTALEELRTAVEIHFPRSFSVVNCAGYFPGYFDITELAPPQARQVMENNFSTLYGIAYAILPIMVQRGGGGFVTFSAHSQYQSYPKMGAFNAAKAAVEAFTMSLSNEYSRAGIRANCFALATMLTPEEEKMKPRGDHANWLTPNEVALRSLELLERADPLVSGNVIHLFKYSDSYFGEAYLTRIEK